MSKCCFFHRTIVMHFGLKINYWNNIHVWGLGWGRGEGQKVNQSKVFMVNEPAWHERAALSFSTALSIIMLFLFQQGTNSLI